MDALELISRAPADEVLTHERLKQYIDEGRKLKHYIGYEISGFVHLGSVVTAAKIADLQKAGVETTVFLADYHSLMNRKLGGDIDTIRRIAKGYFKEALGQCIRVAGGDPEKTRYVMGSELYEKKGIEYLDLVVRIAMNTTISRVKRSITIMGRKEGDSGDSAQYLYPLMQAADIFALGVNVAQAGLDQRKAHVVAIEAGERVAGYKPVALHNHLLMGMHITEEIRQTVLKARREGDRELFEGAIEDIKMSKSKPNTAIFLHESEQEIMSKMNKAFCPAGEAEVNPVLEIAKYVLMANGRGLEIRNGKLGTSKSYASYPELEDDYTSGKIHPADLKESSGRALAELLAPARKYFSEGNGKRYLEEMKSVTISR